MVLGWHAMVPKNTFKVGDICICFEYDSLLDAENPAFAFMQRRGFKVKPQKYTFGGKGNFLSDSLVMSPKDFGWVVDEADGSIIVPPEYRMGKTCVLYEGDPLTEYLKIKYNVPEDNARKALSVDKYKAMASRHPNVFKRGWARWLMRREWGRKLMFIFFGKKKDKKGGYPAWVVKTDEERIQNCPFLLADRDQKWIVTEKVDGTSTTFTMLNNRKHNLIVCSRNVMFDTPEKESRNYYKDSDGNVYLEMAGKYKIYDAMLKAFELDKSLKFLTIQGETYGGSIQKRDYGSEHRRAIFNVIFGLPDGNIRRLNPLEMAEYLRQIQPDDAPALTPVPILSEATTLPTTSDEMLEMSRGESKIDGGMREGIVCRSTDGVKSFKAVDNNFLIKYHN